MAYESFIAVTEPASDINLLTLNELRASTGSDEEPELLVLCARASAAIAGACRVVSDGAHAPTLRRETVRQTFRRKPRSGYEEGEPHALILARAPATSIDSVVEDGVLIDASGYELRPADGILVRLCDDREASWAASKIVVTYKAGFATVPRNLSLIASQLVQILYWQDGRDPNKKSELVQGLGRDEWFGNPLDGDFIPASLRAALAAGGFVNRIPG